MISQNTHISVGEVGRAGKAKKSQWLVEEYSEHRKKGDIRKHSLERQNFKSRSHLLHIVTLPLPAVWPSARDLSDPPSSHLRSVMTR